MKTLRHTVFSRRRALWFAMLVAAGFGLPALAVKPGSNGSRSTATVSISLTVHPSVAARHVNRSTVEAVNTSGIDNDYLCLDVRDTRTLSFFIFAEGTDGTGIIPLARWSFADPPANHHSDVLRCPITVPLNLADVETTATGQLTLIVSPE